MHNIYSAATYGASSGAVDMFTVYICNALSCPENGISPIYLKFYLIKSLYKLAV